MNLNNFRLAETKATENKQVGVQLSCDWQWTCSIAVHFMIESEPRKWIHYWPTMCARRPLPPLTFGAPPIGFRKLSWLAKGEGIKPGTNARNPEPKSGTKFCQQNIAIIHACIELEFGSNVDYRLFFEMHISIFLHLPYFYYMQVKYRTMSWNADPVPTFSVLTMSRNS